MNRPKFRVWSHQSKSFIEGGCYLDCRGYVYDREHVAVRDVDVEMFTGLTDKAGREIYEGDILRGQNAVAVVESRPGYFVGRDVAGYDVELRGIVTAEVVGNVHENPDLLPGKPVKAGGKRRGEP